MSTSIHKNVWLFLPIAFGFAWLFWIPVALTGVDYQTSPRLLAVTLVGVFGPGLAGGILTYTDKDKDARQDFWQRAFDFLLIRSY